jgi:hypothetical protein
VAHPRRFVALDRKALTVGLTAALLTVPMAGVSAAVTLDGADSIDTSALTETELKILESEGLDALTAYQERTATTTVEPVEETVAPVVDAVADAVEKTVSEVAPAPVAEAAPEKKDEGGAAIAGDDPKPVSSSPSSQPASSTSSGSSGSTASSGSSSSSSSFQSNQAIAPSLSNELRATSGFSSSTERPNLQPSAPAPLVSSPFMVQAPQVSGEAVQTPLTALAAAPDFVSSVVQSATTATPLSEHPTGVPGALTATAAALLLMVGAGHVLHRNGDLRRTFAG